MAVFFYNTEIGKIGIQDNRNEITGVFLKEDAILNKDTVCETYLIKEAYNQLEKFLSGKLKEFSIPLNPIGAPFFKKVWNLLNNIPYGEICTYKQIAEKLDNHKCYRAVGLACKRNPIPIFIPCHRVIGSNNSIKGYLGGAEIKEKLLAIETGINNKLT